MNHFLTGFTNELLKIAAQPLEVDAGTADYATPVSRAMSEYSGANAKVGLKGDPKVHPPQAIKALPPQPMTTPNEMVGRLSS